MTETAPTHKPSMLSILRNRNFALLLAAMLVSEYGTGITAIAASILVFRETGSAASVGLMMMATNLPGLFFGLLAGVFVDRVNRKYTIIAVEIIAGLLILLIPLMLQYGIIWLYVLVALKSTAYQFFNPALNSVLPEIASDDELATANSLISASHMAATGLGFATAGAIVSSLSVNWAFYIDATTFFLAAGLISLIAVPNTSVEIESSVASIITNLKQGASFLWGSPALRSIILVTFFMGILFGLWNAAMLPFALTALGASEFDYSLIEGIGLVGFVLGSITMGMIGDRLREGQWLTISFLAMGILSGIFSQLTSVPLAIFVSAVILYFNVPNYIARSLIIQRNTTREVRGRVSSAYFVTRDLAFVIGMATVGLVDVVGAREVLLINAIFTILLGLVATFLPGLRRSGSEWRQTVELLRGTSEALGLDTGRTVTMADIDRLVEVVPLLGKMDLATRQHILPEMTYTKAKIGTTVILKGEVNDNCYVILQGQAVAGWAENNSERVLEVLSAGDFFGEIAALTGQPRTANVITKEETELLRIPARTLRELAKDPIFNRLFYSIMMERMVRMNMIDNPRGGFIDQNAALDVRTVPAVTESDPAGSHII